MKKILFFMLILPMLTQGQIITTIAGTHIAGYSGNGGPATDAKIYRPNQITVDGSGNVYIAESDNNVVRKISTTGIITLVAGNGVAGFSGDGGQATNAKLNIPLAVRFDNAGNLYIPTMGDNRIRKVSPTGIISTIAGSGTAGYSGDGGLADTARLDGPFCLAFDSHGDMYIADNYNNRVRKIDMTTGIISTVAGTGAALYSGDGGPATAATFKGPIDLAFDKTGNMYIAEINSSVIRKIGTTGIITTVTGGGAPGYSGDGGPATAASLAYPYALCTDTSDNIYISDNANACIRKITAATGIIETVAGCGTPGYAGDGGPATDAKIYNAGGVATDPSGNIYIADFGNNVVRKVTMIPTETKQGGHTSSEVTISPNPASKMISLSSPQKITSVQIADLMGHVLATYAPNSFSLQIDISHLPPQTYILRMNNSVSKPFIKE